MQTAPDVRAYFAASSIADPVRRVSALEDFLKTYPKSKHVERARQHRFETLVEYLPERTDDIKRGVKMEIGLYGNGYDRLQGEAAVAEQLAEAGPHGILLPEAEKIASGAENHLNEAKWDSNQAKAAQKSNSKPASTAELHTKYLAYTVNMHLALADVYLHEGKLAQAKPLIDAAYAVQPAEIATNAIRAEYEVATHDNAAALADFERAAVAHDTSELFTDLGKKYRPTLLELYRSAHNGSDSGLEEALDARYNELFPAPFTPEKVAAIQTGHVALLELFTGSGCPPCVGADLAVDALAEQYPRTDLIALSFDEHQPLPDPLANPDSVARASLFHLVGTPHYVLDGTPLSLAGGNPEKSKTIYADLERLVAAEIAAISNVRLTLTANFAADGQVQAQANVTTGTEEETTKLVTETKPSGPPEANGAPIKPGAAKPAKVTGDTDAGAPHLVVNFALVEDHVRYSGENGFRFHRMLVRSLAQPADSGFPLEFAKATTKETSFDPSAVSAKLHEYLVSFGHANQQFFGPIQWRSTDTAIDRKNLVVVAWVQDTTTKRVLQTAIAYPGGQAPGSQTAAKEQN